jgi:hypothetical protein
MSRGTRGDGEQQGTYHTPNINKYGKPIGDTTHEAGVTVAKKIGGKVAGRVIGATTTQIGSRAFQKTAREIGGKAAAKGFGQAVVGKAVDGKINGNAVAGVQLIAGIAEMLIGGAIDGWELARGDAPVERTDVNINAKQSDGVKHAFNKVAEYEGYNTLGFDGGGSSQEMEYALGNNVGGPSDDEDAIAAWNALHDVSVGGDVGEVDYNAITESTMLITKSNKYERETSTGAQFDYSLPKIFGVGACVQDHLSFVSGNTKTFLQTTVVENSDSTESVIHLEDPDIGDYFVVKLFYDPDYGTPFFALDGGASSCQWEVFTAHRSAPTLQISYLGPDRPAADEPALFKVTLGQATNYYQNSIGFGPNGELFRTGWKGTDTGYVPANMEFFIDPGTLTDGLQAKVNGAPFSSKGIVYEEFGKGSKDVIVELRRGPLEYDYAAPVLGWRTMCGGGAVGENQYGHTKADPNYHLPYYRMAMNFAGPGSRPGFRDATDVGIGFVQPCPTVSLSGKILADGTFKSTFGSVEVAVAATSSSYVPPGAAFEPRPVEAIRVQYRRISNGIPALWSDFRSEGADDVPPTGEEFLWEPPKGLDGLYDIRLVAVCDPIGSVVPDDDGAPVSTVITANRLGAGSTSAIIRGVVDRTPPQLLSGVMDVGDLSSGWQARGKPAAGWQFTVTFTEPMVCVGDNWGLNAQVLVTLDTGEKKQHVLNKEANNFVCDGVRLIGAVPNNILDQAYDHDVDAAGSRSYLEAATKPPKFFIKIIDGMRDVAGNELAVKQRKKMIPLLYGETHLAIAESHSSVQGTLSDMEDRLNRNMNVSLTSMEERHGDLVRNVLDNLDALHTILDPKAAATAASEKADAAKEEAKKVGAAMANSELQLESAQAELATKQAEFDAANASLIEAKAAQITAKEVYYTAVDSAAAALNRVRRAVPQTAAVQNAELAYADANATLASARISYDEAKSALDSAKAKASSRENALDRAFAKLVVANATRAQANEAAKIASRATADHDYHQETWRLLVATFIFLFLLIVAAGVAGAAYYKYHFKPFVASGVGGFFTAPGHDSWLEANDTTPASPRPGTDAPYQLAARGPSVRQQGPSGGYDLARAGAHVGAYQLAGAGSTRARQEGAYQLASASTNQEGTYQIASAARLFSDPIQGEGAQDVATVPSRLRSVSGRTFSSFPSKVPSDFDEVCLGEVTGVPPTRHGSSLIAQHSSLRKVSDVTAL